jgi:predicted ribosome quality control (RQC) complex YloA/Tae2 family protein
MRLRKKPKNPGKRKKMEIFLTDLIGAIPDGNFEDALGEARKYVLEEARKYINNGHYGNLLSLRIKTNYDWDHTELAVFGVYDEADEAFDKRKKNYEEKLADYNKWYEENEEKIKSEIERREEKKKEVIEKKLAEIEKKKEQLQNQLEGVQG